MVKKAKILIVEDELKISKAYRDHFENTGYTVVVASDGQEGLRVAKSTLPDIILLDIIMPVMDGLAMLRALKADPALAMIPVIMLTNLDTNESVMTAIAAGSTHYLIKANYSLEALGARVQEVLSNHI
jgi:DNA-binding response OmpR family regulator